MSFCRGGITHHSMPNVSVLDSIQTHTLPHTILIFTSSWLMWIQQPETINPHKTPTGSMCVSPGYNKSCDNDNLTLAGNKICENFSLDNIRRILIYHHSAPLSLLTRHVLALETFKLCQLSRLTIYTHPSNIK